MIWVRTVWRQDSPESKILAWAGERERAGDHYTTQWSSVQMHPSDLWQFAQELEAVKLPQCNAVPNSSDLWVLAQHLFKPCLLISIRYSTASNGCIYSNWYAKLLKLICFAPVKTWWGIHFSSDPLCDLGQATEPLWAALPSRIGVCDTWYLQNGEAHIYAGVRDNICTADTWLGHTTLYCPLLLLDGDLVRWFLVRMFLSAPGSTECRRRAGAGVKHFLLCKWGLSATSDMGAWGWPVFTS